MTRRDSGFTLIEVTVALALTALVSLILLQGIRLASSGLDRHARATERLDARQSLDDLLRRTLGAAVLLPRGTGADFVGRPEAVELVALAEDGGAGVYRVDLGIDRTRRGQPLVLLRRLAMSAGEPRAVASVVATNVRDFRLAYFGTAGTDAEPRWHDSWEQLAVLPLMVRVTLDAEGAPPRPPLVVRLWGAS